MNLKKLTSCLLALLICCGCLLPLCFAESFTGQEGLTVTLTAEGKMEDNLPDGSDAASARALQPGDDITFSVTVINLNAASTEWYMKNQILYSLEDRSASAAGGAYTYRLCFIADDGTETVLFDSDTVGGEGESPVGPGLHEADDALREYFYFCTLHPGHTGTVTLYVALDGESQGNSYQDTLADLRMAFAVALLGGDTSSTEPSEAPDPTHTEPEHPTGEDSTEPTGGQPTPTSPAPTNVTVVKTGDDTRLFPFFLAMAISGLLLLVLLLRAVLRRRRPRERGR